MNPIYLSILAILSLLQANPEEGQHNPVAPHHDGAVAPIVVELFTSQGCPLCPSANVLLGELAQRDNIIAIGWGVSYWDMYGWEDQYGQPEFIRRQQDYVDTGEASRVFTPHFVVNGRPEKLRFRADEIRQFVDQSAALSQHAVRLTPTGDGHIRVEFDDLHSSSPAEVWLVRYEAGEAIMLIEEGGNAGLDMPHYNMARGLTRLPDWQNGPYSQTVEMPDPSLSYAVLVQDGRGGPLLAAGARP